MRSRFKTREITMNLQAKKIGIWGFGIVGKAALNYFATKKNQLTVMESRLLTEQESGILKNFDAQFIEQKEYKKFLEENDVILASPGIDLRNYSKYAHKFITELDLFTQENKKNTIAITGTIGKTTITHLLTKIIEKHEPVLKGGNIGIGMLDLLKPSQANKIILEVSSFQLEHCTQFAPDLAVWTNFYPNHLDRHKTVEEYFNAKYTLLKYQNKNQNALVPLELASKIMHTHNSRPKSTLHFFSIKKPCLHTYRWLPSKSTLFWIENSKVIHCKNHQQEELISLKNISDITYEQNWLILIAALKILNVPLNATVFPQQEHLEHRLEKLPTPANQATIYNDSKSTIMESTLAAVEKLHGKNILLLLGGLSKGVTRKEPIEQLRGKVKEIICFGDEALALNEYAKSATIPSKAFPCLESATAYALNKAQSEDQILLSPGGSSYDLFKNYEERGTYFKKLVKEYREKK